MAGEEAECHLTEMILGSAPGKGAAEVPCEECHRMVEAGPPHGKSQQQLSSLNTGMQGAYWRGAEEMKCLVSAGRQ